MNQLTRQRRRVPYHWVAGPSSSHGSGFGLQLQSTSSWRLRWARPDHVGGVYHHQIRSRGHTSPEGRAPARSRSGTRANGSTTGGPASLGVSGEGLGWDPPTGLRPAFREFLPVLLPSVEQEVDEGEGVAELLSAAALGVVGLFAFK